MRDGREHSEIHFTDVTLGGVVTFCEAREKGNVTYRKRVGFTRYRDPKAVHDCKSRWHHETPPRPANGPGAYSILDDGQ